MNLREAKELARKAAGIMHCGQRGPWSAAYAIYCFPYSNKYLVGWGMARCCPRDQPNPELGLEIAKGRAIADIARQLVKEG